LEEFSTIIEMGGFESKKKKKEKIGVTQGIRMAVLMGSRGWGPWDQEWDRSGNETAM